MARLFSHLIHGRTFGQREVAATGVGGIAEVGDRMRAAEDGTFNHDRFLAGDRDVLVGRCAWRAEGAIQHFLNGDILMALGIGKGFALVASIVR